MEIIIGDDSTNDKTERLINEQYLPNYTNITYIRNSTTLCSRFASSRSSRKPGLPTSTCPARTSRPSVRSHLRCRKVTSSSSPLTCRNARLSSNPASTSTFSRSPARSPSVLTRTIPRRARAA